MKRHLYRMLRYTGTAGLAAVLDLGGFVLLLELGLPAGWAAAASFAMATVVNYQLSARLVFGHVPTWLGYGRFLVAAIGGFAVNVGITLLMLNSTGLPAPLAKAIGIGLAFLLNFLLNTVFVFGAKAMPTAAGSTDQEL